MLRDLRGGSDERTLSWADVKPLVGQVSPQDLGRTTRGFTLVTYVATLDVPRQVVDHLSRLLVAHQRRIGTPRGSRALGLFRQAVLVLRWFRERACVHCLARDFGVSQATGYRYLHEGIDVLAGQAPDLHHVLDRARREGMTHVILDGT
jgi:hypothetical protein